MFGWREANCPQNWYSVRSILLAVKRMYLGVFSARWIGGVVWLEKYFKKGGRSEERRVGKECQP